MVRARTFKRIHLSLSGADRNPWKSGEFKLAILDHSNLLKRIWFQTPNGRRTNRLRCNRSELKIEVELNLDANQRYCLIAAAKGHHDDARFLNRRSFRRGIEQTADVDARMILIPKQADSSDLDDGFGKLEQMRSPLSQGISKAQYTNLQSSAQMALLNIEAKLRETKIDGSRLIDSVTGLQTKKDGSLAVDSDRIYVKMRSGVKDALQDNAQRARAQFTSAWGHKEEVGLGAHPHSWKHQAFPRGNLQLSFSQNPINGLEYSVDVDIDLERNFVNHLVEWFWNELSGEKTNQKVVYRLLYEQGIHPVYTLSQTGNPAPGPRTPEGQ